MLVDYHTHLGNWPFRQLGERGRKRALLQELQECGVAEAMVSPLNALFSEYIHNENLALIRELANTDRLTPVPVADLRMHAALRNWEEYEQAYGKKLNIVRLAPSLLGYDLMDPLVADYLRAIAVNTVVIAIRYRDIRQGLPGWRMSEVQLDSILSLAEHMPEISFVINGLRGLEFDKSSEQLIRQPNVKIDLSFMDGVGVVEKAIQLLGKDRVVQGSGYPIHDMHASVLKYQLACEIRPNLFNRFIDNET